MSSIELVNMESKAKKEMVPIMARATAFVVRDEQTYVDADLIITEVRAKVKVLEPEFSPTKETATKAWKAAVALWKKYIDDPLEACKTLDRKRYAWKKAEDDKRARQAETLRREAERKQEVERKAEAARIAAEAKKQADEALALAERLKAADMPEQADAILTAAGQEEERGMEQAQEVLDAPAAPVDVPAPVKVVVPTGQSNVQNWQATVIDAALVPRNFLIPDLVALGKYAKLMKSKASVPGVVFEDVGSTRRRA